MKYTSKKGTTINIPDGLTAKQIASIKADADAGYGTRAQQTATDLGKKLAGGGVTPQPSNNATVINTLQQRADSGTIGPKDQARLDSLKAGTPSTPTQNNPNNLSPDRQATIINTLEQRAASGNIGPKDQARLNELKGSQPGLDENITADRAATIIATLEGRANAGTIGPKDQARLNDLKAKFPAASKPSPTEGGGQVTDPNNPIHTFEDPGGAITPGTVDKTGTVDPVKAGNNVSDAETGDINTNFNLEHPRTITDQNGNKRTITKNADGTVTVTDEKGGIAKTFSDLATAAAQTFNGDVSRQKAQDATYGTLTKYYDRDQAREEENAKQELANRGIPYDPAAAQDPNSKNLYGRTIGGIGQKYQGMKDTASQQAVLSGNAAYATDASARDSFLNAVTSGASTFGGQFGNYQNTVQTDQSQDTKDLISLSSQAFLAKYGIDKDTYTKKLAINKGGSSGGGGGGGSGGGGGGSGGGGFEITG